MINLIQSSQSAGRDENQILSKYKYFGSAKKIMHDSAADYLRDRVNLLTYLDLQ
jgi:hypothetical protein